MHKNSKGFTLVEGLLMILIICLVAGIGFYVFNNREFKQASNDTSKTASSDKDTNEQKDEAPKTSVADPYAGWKTYDNNGLSFKYPSDYRVDSSADNFVEVTSFQVDGSGDGILGCASVGQTVPKCEVKLSILEKGTFDDKPGEYYAYSPSDSDKKDVAEKIIATIKRQ